TRNDGCLSPNSTSLSSLRICRACESVWAAIKLFFKISYFSSSGGLLTMSATASKANSSNVDRTVQYFVMSDRTRAAWKCASTVANQRVEFREKNIGNLTAPHASIFDGSGPWSGTATPGSAAGGGVAKTAS